MSRQLLLVDFDRTLFDTGRFVGQMWREIATIYDVDPQVEQERAKDFYIYAADGWYDYDFFAHIDSIHEITDERTVFIGRMHQVLASTDFLFDDAETIVPLIDAIVTFGNRLYQQFKLDLCPSLASITTHIITEHKGDFIQRNFADHNVILVDDKRLDDALPPTARFIHLDRAQELPLEEHSTYTSVNSLIFIPQLVS